jgi:hypothetical protein
MTVSDNRSRVASSGRAGGPSGYAAAVSVVGR